MTLTKGKPSMSLPIVCSKGNKGRFIASDLEFEIVDTTSTTSTIQFHWTRERHELQDTDLRAAAVGIAEFTRKN